MQTIKIITDNTEVIIGDEGITIHGDNIRINEAAEEQSTKGSMNTLINELKNNSEFEDIIKKIICDSLLKK